MVTPIDTDPPYGIETEEPPLTVIAVVVRAAKAAGADTPSRAKQAIANTILFLINRDIYGNR